ncbi:MAG TPA: hypothetical protein VE463_03090 [Blastococcus sp.]|nr:hypothetical protein [Blastococcus sp.]
MSTSPRTAAALLCVLLAGPLLAGCGEDAPETSASSSATVEEPATGAASESASADTEEEGTADAPDLPADVEPDTADASADARVTVSDIRIGAHEGFDRVVLEVGGTGTPGWDVRYVDVAAAQGTGDPVDVAGDAVLQVTLTGAGYPYDTGVEEYAGGPLTSADTTVLTEVVWGATYEGTSLAFLGTTGQYPFRVYSLTGPTRVVVDIAHAAG